MKLKAGKEDLLLACIICLIPIVGGIMYLIYGITTGEDVGVIVILEFSLLVISMCFCVEFASYLREVEMNALGCKISWLWWEREYSWNDFEIISKDLWCLHLRYTKDKYYKGVIFLKKKKNKKGKDIDGADINFSMKYLTEAFYVVFPSEEKYTFKEYTLGLKCIFEKVSLSDPFCVNEAEFMRQLEEWNVPVTETKRYKRWKYTGRI